jgi:hypothetical protein
MPEPDVEHPISYNWHPAVHDLCFEEKLYFVMIRLKEPLHRPVAEQVSDLLKAADVQHACAYPLFGWWDALIRVWLAPPAWRRLGAEIKDKPAHNVADVQVFTTSSIHYLWRGNKKDALSPEKKIKTAIAGHKEDIETLAQVPDRTDTEVWATLEKNGLIFKRPPTREGGVKFYTSLERTGGDHSVETETDAIFKAMNSTVLGTTGSRMAKQATLYCGAGNLSDYLVRCVAENYDDVLALAEAFDKHLRKTRLRPMTLLVANPGASFESDHVNNILHLSQDHANAADLLGLSPKVIANLQPADRQAITKLTFKAFELSNEDQPLRDMLIALLQATALNDHAALQSSLSFLLAFEPYFKKRLTREFNDIFGPHWYPMLLKLFGGESQWKKHAEEIAKDLDTWTLANFILTAIAASELNLGFRGSINGQLGSGWKAEADALKNLRNDLAHGRVHEFPRLDVYDQKLIEFLSYAINAAVFWRRCVDKPNNNGKGI